jgi:hypothetical protein
MHGLCVIGSHLNLKLSRTFASVMKLMFDDLLFLWSGRFFGESGEKSEYSAGCRDYRDFFRNFGECATPPFFDLFWMYNLSYYITLTLLHTHRHPTRGLEWILSYVCNIWLLSKSWSCIQSKMHTFRGRFHFIWLFQKWSISCEPQVCCHQSPKRGRLEEHLGFLSGFWLINYTRLWT